MVIAFFKWTIVIEIFRMMDKNIKKYQNLSDFSLKKKLHYQYKRILRLIFRYNYFIILSIIKYN